ncbi:MAG: aldo/keto reductase [Acidobacteria bacterium]|nr:aldo/keto reductase [Acidobacteriota bacterium]
MREPNINRRQFFRSTGALLAGAMITPWQDLISAAPKGFTPDLVTLGKSGVRLCRLGFGTGTNSGQVQRDLGREGFSRLFRYAYDRGVTYIDTADGYGTHTYVKEAIRGIPREKLFILSKMWWSPENIKNPMAALDRYRRELGVEYLDCLLIHCTMQPSWPQDLKPMMEAFDTAKERKIIRLKGMSCHGLPALRQAAKVPWADVQLARVNPQGHAVDGESPDDSEGNMDLVGRELKTMKGMGRGILGMKLVGNGDFTRREDRVRAMQYAMQCGFVDAVTIGFAGTAEVDEALENMGAALAAGAKAA